ncbi:MAG TPA: DUF481 domain-containing protein [Verrucomicrobiota bacterium]|nr:DUF481 domain-containing protein [Verrucomicrobiota bacterium]HOP97507.1 DUF481 domain-containing protein [Verrucomicrobiota bacterium]
MRKGETASEAAATPARSPGETPPGGQSWRGEAQVGVDFTEGASDRQTWFGRFKLAYERSYAWDPKKSLRNGLDAMAEYGETTAAGENRSIRSSDRLSVINKTSADIRRRWYAYNLVGGGYDHIKRIDAQYEAGPGAGYHLFTLTDFSMNAEAGLNYQAQYRDDGSVVQDFYYRLAEDFSWRIRKNVLLTERFEFFPRVNFSNYRIRFESTLSYGLPMNLALNLTVLDLYDTQPAEGVSHNELQIRSSLGWKF